jgi:hypothetical protein
LRSVFENDRFKAKTLSTNPLRIGEKVPAFEAETTHGRIRFHGVDRRFLGRPLLTSKGFYPSLHDKTMAARLREAYNVCDKHRDVATASLIEVWIDETERRTWLLFEATRRTN